MTSGIHKEWKKGVSPKGLLFTKIYPRNGCRATEAAIQAGYKPKNAKIIAYKNLQKPRIRKLVEQEMEKVKKRIEISFDDKLEKLWEVVETCLNDKQYSKSVISAISELNKMQGHHAAQKHVVSTDAEYRALLESKLNDAVYSK